MIVRCNNSNEGWQSWPMATSMLETNRDPQTKRQVRCLAPYWMNSPHFCTVASPPPQGMIGTEEVEFFGEPSISLSEYTM